MWMVMQQGMTHTHTHTHIHTINLHTTKATHITQCATTLQCIGCTHSTYTQGMHQQCWVLICSITHLLSIGMMAPLNTLYNGV